MAEIDEKALRIAVDRYCHLIGEPYNGIRHEVVASTILAYEAAKAAPVDAVPAGWKLVPVDPTEAMLNHISGANFSALSPSKQRAEREAYRAVLAASPAPPPDATAAGGVAVKALDLSNILKHAFLSGVVAAREIAGHEECDGPALWAKYEPYEPGPYDRIRSALVPAAGGVDAVRGLRQIVANLASVVRVQNGNRHDDINALLSEADAALASPAPSETGGDGRPKGWTEALAISFMAENGHNPEMGTFAKSFNEGAWREIEAEWPEFLAFARTRLSSAPSQGLQLDRVSEAPVLERAPGISGGGKHG
jgi:hypothetical protein